MKTRHCLAISIAVAAAPVGACQLDASHGVRCGFDEDLSAWTVVAGTCTHLLTVGASKAGSVACDAAALTPDAYAVHLRHCATTGASGPYVFGADAHRLAGADVACTTDVEAYRNATCSDTLGFSSSRWSPGSTGFLHALPASLQIDAATRAVSIDLACASTAPFSVVIDDVFGVIDPIFKHGFEFRPPVLTAGATLNYTENQAATVIDATITVNDPDSTTLLGASAQISANYQNGVDVLAFTPVGGITGSFVAATGTLGLTGSSTLANYQTALRSVTFVNGSDTPTTGARTIAWTANDGANSAVVTSTVTMAAVNDAPGLAGTSDLGYTENQAAQVISASITVTDVDSTTLAGATVRISTNFDTGKDVLAFTPVGGITGSFVGDTLTLSGVSSLANYQTALRSVTYVNTSDNPSALARQVPWRDHDGAGANNLSNTPTSTITVTAVNDVPTGAVPAGSPFAITGNVRRTVGTGTLLAGATDPEGDTLIAQLSGVPTNGATVVVNTNGSFSYNPGAGYDGPASFQFVVCDPAPGCSTPVTVNVGITGMIWFIDDSVGAGTGRLTDPMNSIATFQGVNNGTGNNPAPNDNIYLFAGTYTGAMTLLAGQRLFGEGMSVTLAAATGITPPAGSDTLPTTVPANRPAWTSSGTTLTLGSGNTIRGFNIGNSTTAKIVGTGIGTLTVSEIALSGTGQALNLATGAFSASSAFSSITTTSSGTQGIVLSGITGGALTIGGTTISGATTQGILVTGSAASVNFGNTTVAAGTDGISLQNNSGGTRTFGTLGITGGTGAGFLHAVGGGTTTAGVTTVTNPAGTGISIANSTTAVTFGNTTVNKGVSAGTGVDIANSTGTVTFGLLAITTSNGTALSTNTATSIVVTSATSTLNATGGPAINSVGTGWTAQFASATSTNSGTIGIGVTDITGTLNLGSGSVTAPAGTGFVGTGALGTTTYAGSVTKANDGKLVVISGTAGGDVTLSGALSCTTPCDGIDVLNRNAGTIAFTNFSKVLNTGPSNAITLTNNNGAAIDFTGGGLDIDTTGGIGLSASGVGPGASTGGTLTVQGSINTISTTTGAALSLVNTTIGAANLTFRSISVDGIDTAPTNAIVLNNTGTAGGLVVTGQALAGTGGTLRDTSGDAILLTSTERFTIARMNITSNLGCGIRGTSVNGFDLDLVNITSNGDSAANDESGINLTNLTGTAVAGARRTRLVNTTVSNNFEFEVQITNSTGTLTVFEMLGTTMSSDGFQPSHGNLMNFLALGTATMTLNVVNGAFTGNTDTSGGRIITATGVQCDHSGTSGTLTCNISNGQFTNNNVGPQASVAGGGQVVFDFDTNLVVGSRSHGINVFADANPPFTKTINGRIRNNTIGTVGVTGSGSTVGFPIRVQNEGRVPVTLAITNNTVQESVGFTGINVNHGISTTAGTAATNVTITGNTVREIDSGRAVAVQVSDFLPAGGNAGTVCADISGNIISNVAGQAGDGTWIRLRQSASSAPSIFNVRQLAATGAANVNEIDDANGFNDTARISVGGAPTYNAGACTQPSN